MYHTAMQFIRFMLPQYAVNLLCLIKLYSCMLKEKFSKCDDDAKFLHRCDVIPPLADKVSSRRVSCPKFYFPDENPRLRKAMANNIRNLKESFKVKIVSVLYAYVDHGTTTDDLLSELGNVCDRYGKEHIRSEYVSDYKRFIEDVWRFLYDKLTNIEGVN